MLQLQDEQVTRSGTTIAERNEVDTPNSQVATVTVNAEADLLIEYVSATEVPGSSGVWQNNRYLRRLPNPSDDLMSDHGSSLYDVDMPRDPQVYSTLSVLVMAVMAQGTRFDIPQGFKEGDEDHKAALTIKEFCQLNLDNLEHSWFSILDELVTSMLKMGHKVGEKIYVRGTLREEWGRQLLLRDIKTKPHEATAFVCDGFNNELGLLYTQPGRPMPSITSVVAQQAQTPIASPGIDDRASNERQANVPRMIPREKFVIPRHKPRNGDPRGTSHIRSVYGPYWKKQNIHPQHLAYLARFAQPSAVAKLSKDAKDVPIKDASGNVIAHKSIVSLTTQALAKIKGGAVGSFIDTDVMLLEAKGNGEVIFKSYEHEDRQIAKGMLMQTLTTEESRSMARAASAIHQDVFGIFVAYLRSIIEWTIKWEVLMPLVRYNYGKDAARRLCPTVSLGVTQVQDIPKLMAAIAQLANAKGIHWSQWPKIWPLVGVPDADMDVWLEDIKRQQRMEEEAAAAKNGAAQGGSGGGGPRSNPENNTNTRPEQDRKED